MDKNFIQIVITLEPIMHFDVLLDLEYSEPYLHTLFYEERQKTDTLAVIDNYNSCDKQTHTPKLRLSDRPGPAGRVGENGNI